MLVDLKVNLNNSEKDPVFIRVFDLNNEDDKIEYENLLNESGIEIISEKISFAQKGTYVVLVKYKIRRSL